MPACRPAIAAWQASCTRKLRNRHFKPTCNHLPGQNAVVIPVWFAGKATEVVAAFDKVKQQLGHPEVLIYNAGPGGISWPPPSKAPRKLSCTTHDGHDMPRNDMTASCCIWAWIWHPKLSRHTRGCQVVQIGDQQFCSVPMLTQSRQQLAYMLDCN